MAKYYLIGEGEENMTTELKTVHSFWIPTRILDTLRSTVQELEKKESIKISSNRLAINLIDAGLTELEGQQKKVKDKGEV
jgi:hypothetical protein